MSKHFKDNMDTKLMPNYDKYSRAKIRGNTIRCELTLNPTHIGENETLYVKVPKLEAGSVIIPESLRVIGKIKNKNTKSWFLNNISALLQKEIRVRFGKIDVYHNSHHSDWLLYNDLWQTEKNRAVRVDEGIGSENYRKLLCGDDSGATSGNAGQADEKTLSDLYKNEISIPVGHMLCNQGVFAPRALNSEFELEITFPKASDVMKAQASQSVAGYTFEELKLKYDKIVSPELYQMCEQSYISGRTIPFKNIDRFEINKADWKKDTTIVNMRVNIPRRSLCAVVMLFRDDTTGDSEKFPFPKIKDVKLQIDGSTNQVYSGGSGGITKSGMFRSARDFFLDHTEEVITPTQFYAKDKFALVLDLRTVPDKNVFANGKQVMDTQSGLSIEITKEATAKDMTCYLYLVSDGIININDKTVTRVNK